MKVLYFSAVWCGPCKMLGPVVEMVTNELDLDVRKVDVDASPELTAKYSVSSVPTLVFLNKDGEEVKRSVGFIPKPKLVDLVKSLEE
jgi:thioredoxin 1